MKILDLYIARIIAATTFLTLLILVGLNAVIMFVEQMKSVGTGNYELSHAVLYVLYSVPRHIETFFPMSALIGGLIGLGSMASNSELVVMQAAGLSRFDIIKSVMKSASVLVLISMAIGEWAAPQGEATAREIRTQALSGGSLISAKNGIWAKDGDVFVHIGEVQDTGSLSQLQIFEFDEQLQLTKITEASQAEFAENVWNLNQVEVTYFTAEKITKERLGAQRWQSTLTPEKLGVMVVKPKSLSIQGLVSYLEYVEANQQDPRPYQLKLWQKIMQPITVAVMLLVALSYIFGPLRSVSMGARIVLGVVTGIGFILINQVFASVSLVYQLPPIVGALLPSILFVSVAVYFIRKRV